MALAGHWKGKAEAHYLTDGVVCEISGAIRGD